MSALGSSVINKSGKKFAPKAPIRRPTAPGAPSSTGTSARASIDRLSSQTPNPPAVQQRALSPPPRASSPTSTRLQQPIVPVAAPASATDVATLIPKPGSKTSSDIRPRIEWSPQPSITPRKRTLNADTLPHTDTSASGSLIAAGESVPELSPPPSEVQEQGISRALAEASSVESTVSATLSAKDPTPLAPRGTEDEAEQLRSPAAKRQWTENERRDASTATGEAVSTRVMEIPVSTATEDFTTAPDATATVAQVSRASKRKPPAQGKNRQRVEALADEVIGDATRSSSSHARKGVPPAKKAVRKRTKAKEPQRAEDAAAEIVADAVGGAARTTRKRGRRRQATPDNAEEVQIEAERVTIADLCKDPRTGRMSKAEAEFRALDEERARKRQQQIANSESPGDRVDEILEAAGVMPQQSTGGTQAAEPDEEPEYGSSQVIPETRIVNGEIVIDMDSLEVDRQALAEVQRNQEPTEIIEESGITRRVNYGTFSKKIVSTRWTEESTELFYEGLRMFGTDFEMISKLFPNRTRRHIKLKFVKEERVDCARIKETLLGEKVPVDMDELSKISNIKFRNVEDFNRELDSDRLELEERAAMERQEKDNALQLRSDEAAAEAAAVGANSSDDERNATDKTEGFLSGKRKHRNSTSMLPGSRDAGGQARDQSNTHGGDPGPTRQGVTPEIDSDGALDITNEPAPPPPKRSRGKATGQFGNAGGKRPSSGVAAPGKTPSRSAAQRRRAETTRAAAGRGRNKDRILQSVE